MRILSMALLFVAFSPALMASAPVPKSDEATSEPDPAPVFADVTSVDELRQLLIDFSDLRDPFTVQFRRTQSSSSGQLTVFCGQLNAKNANGAYIGWSDFVFLKGTNPNKLFVDNGQAGFVDRVMIRNACKTAQIASEW